MAAFDPAGNEGPPAAAVTTLTQGVAVPAGLTAVPGIGRIELRWTPNTDSGLQGYNVYRSERSSGGFSRLAGDGGADFTTGQTSYIDSNLTGGQLFFYKVSALTDVNESDQSTFVGGEVQVDEVGPGAPTDVVAIADEIEPRVELTWSAPLLDRTGGPLTGLATYIIFRSKGTANTPVPIETLVATQNSYVDTDVEEATTYFYSVQALDASNNRSPRTNSPGVVTPGVAVPLSLGAVNGIGRITLTLECQHRSGCSRL